MQYLVLGAGALGGYFGAKLLQGGADVEFLVRPKRAAQLAEHSLVVKAHEGDIRIPVKTVQAGQIAHPYDVILLCCKAYDLEAAMDAVSPAIGPGSAILPVLNGVNHIDILSGRFGRQHVLGGLMIVNAALTPEGNIVQSAVSGNMTTFGELNGATSDRCLAIERAFAAGGMGNTLSETVMAQMWAKFVLYGCAATVATLCRSRAGAIAAAPASASFVEAVIDECTRVAMAEGYNPPESGAELVRSLYSQTDSKYGPSILVDMEEGRRTEGEHTIGDMADRAARHGIAAPILTAARCNLQVYEVLRSKK
jgi:2-dehydropantoate 2-reductase